MQQHLNFARKKHVSDSFGGVRRNRWKRQHENQQGTTTGNGQKCKCMEIEKITARALTPDERTGTAYMRKPKEI